MVKEGPVDPRKVFETLLANIVSRQIYNMEDILILDKLFDPCFAQVTVPFIVLPLLRSIYSSSTLIHLLSCACM